MTKDATGNGPPVTAGKVHLHHPAKKKKPQRATARATTNPFFHNVFERS